MSLITTLGECRDGHIFKGEHYILFSYDLGWLWYCAGWRQSPLLAELHVIGISLLKDQQRLVTFGMLGLWPGCSIQLGSQVFQHALDEKQWNLFFLPALQEWVLLQVPAWQPSVQESSLCLWEANRHGCHSLSCQFWKDLSCQSFFSILDSVHSVCSCEHRLSAHYDLGSAIQHHCISIFWVDMVLGFVTWYSYITPGSCCILKSFS